MNKRIGLSYKEKRQELVWLDDKLEQVGRTEALLKGERHLPLLGHARKGDAVGLEKLAQKLAVSSEPLVVKPRHGSNSKHVFLWPRPQEVDAKELEESVLKASESHDKSWDKESWNQNAVPKGVVLQPMYSPLAEFLHGYPCDEMERSRHAFERGVCPKFLRPLELKVQTLFGEVVGAQLNTHPQYLWVARDGSVHVWDQMAEGFQTRHAKEPEELPKELALFLRDILQEHWQRLRSDSEMLARSAGLDEIRVDWLLGDPKWGPRIGELTHMGTFAIELVPVSVRLARAFAHAHLQRKGEAIPFACF
ncbi:unnamed protein product [Symbiodinium natans]|uniref:ATP-grasp domain-containing protein n=1 Tax=Symbiodinium natans TaxID=878477 RepID=A0A812TKF4_9DINO|nr:unnamed protein product [Symbiodinium natans]